MKITAPNSNLLSPQGTQGLGTPPPREKFDSLLGKMLDETSRLQQDGDQKIGGTMLGKEDLHDTMLALEKASLGLKLLIQVRNKMVSAYEELSRMPL